MIVERSPLRPAGASIPGLALVLSLAAIACGPSIAPRNTQALRAELEAAGLPEASETAPDLVDAAHEALARAEEAEAAQRLDEVADHATRARLYAEAALAEQERIAAERERLELEQRALQLEEQILADERDARAVEEESRRLAAAEVAREELERARTRAEEYEAHPGRRARHSIGDDGEARRAAIAIRERARVLAAAAIAIGADAALLNRIEELVARGTAAPPIESLALAEQALDQARDALAAARRARPGPSPEEIASAIEAIEEAGLEAVRLDRGLGIEASGLFRGTSAAPERGAEARIARIAAIAQAHPHGALALEIDVPSAGEAATRLARQRAEWARRALVAAGVPAERLSYRAPGSTIASPSPGDRVRVILLAYVPRD